MERQRTRRAAGIVIAMAMLGTVLLWLVLRGVVSGPTKRSIVVDPAATRAASSRAVQPKPRAPVRTEREYSLRVLDPSGNPVGGALVWRFPPEASFFLSAGPPPSPKSTTDSSGVATIKSYWEQNNLAVRAENFAPLEAR